MTEETEDTPLPREQVAEFIPEALRTAMTIYHELAARRDYIDKDKKIDHDEFVKWQKALKAAVAHIDLLVKVALYVELPESDTDANRQAVTAALLRQVMEDVAGFEMTGQVV